MKDSLLDFFEQLPHLRGLKKRGRERLVREVQEIRLARRAKLWRDVGRRTRVYWVWSGLIRRHQLWKRERGITLGWFGRGEMIGEEILHDLHRAGDMATAHEPSVVYGLNKAVFLEIIGKKPEVWSDISKVVMKRHKIAQRRLSEMAYCTADVRVMRLLKQLSEQFGVRDSRGTLISIRLTHRDIAEWVGSSRETVSLVLADLRKRNLIEMSAGRVVILDGKALHPKRK